MYSEHTNTNWDSVVMGIQVEPRIDHRNRHISNPSEYSKRSHFGHKKLDSQSDIENLVLTSEMCESPVKLSDRMRKIQNPLTACIPTQVITSPESMKSSTSINITHEHQSIYLYDLQ